MMDFWVKKWWFDLRHLQMHLVYFPPAVRNSAVQVSRSGEWFPERQRYTSSNIMDSTCASLIVLDLMDSWSELRLTQLMVRNGLAFILGNDLRTSANGNICMCAFHCGKRVCVHSFANPWRSHRNWIHHIEKQYETERQISFRKGKIVCAQKWNFTAAGKRR